MSPDDDAPHILGIIPAPGWWACYDDGGSEPLMAFALVEQDGTRWATAVVPDGRTSVLAETLSNFTGLKYRGPWVAPE